MPINVRLRLPHVHFAGPSDSPVQRPYLWTVFFAIDGAPISVSGTPRIVVRGTDGRHGNLGGANHAPARIDVPAKIGQWEIGLVPHDDVVGGAIVGVVIVLMEEDNVSDSGAEAGYAELVRQVRAAVDQVAAGDLTAVLNVDELTERIRSAVAAAIEEHQNFLENLWSLLNKDDTLGTNFWFGLHDQIEGEPAVTTTLQIAQGWSIDSVMETFVESELRFASRFPFDRVAVGDTRVGTVTVSNFTSSGSTVLADLDGSNQFTLVAPQVSVAASTERALSVVFRPTATGRSEATLTIRRASDGRRLFRADLTGTTAVGPLQ